MQETGFDFQSVDSMPLFEQAVLARILLPQVSSADTVTVLQLIVVTVFAGQLEVADTLVDWCSDTLVSCNFSAAW